MSASLQEEMATEAQNNIDLLRTLEIDETNDEHERKLFGTILTTIILRSFGQ